MKKNMKEKKCSKCKEVKNVSEFWNQKHSSTGYYSSCKKCNYKVIKNKECKFCGKSFKPYTSLDKFCSVKCRVDNVKSKRTSNWSKESTSKIKGKNNPSYRNGMYSSGNK